MLAYIFLCIISILTGRGFLHLIGVQIDKRLSLYLSPIVTLCLWTVFLGWTVQFGYTVKQVWVYGYLASLSLAFFGIYREDFKALGLEWGPLIVTALAPVALMIPYFWHGITVYPGSPAPDGWSYIAFGQYLWEYPKSTHGGLAPLYQYASHLSGTRFIGSALLGFFSPLTGAPGDTQAASGIFLSWALFIFSASCMFFAKTSELGRGYQLLYVAICVISGNLLKLLTANNYDNLLALSFLPVYVGMLVIATPSELVWSIVFGLMSSGVLYCYPEMSLFIFMGFFWFVLTRIVSERNDFITWIVFLLATVLVAIIVTVPWLSTFFVFFSSQFGSASTHHLPRPGQGMFVELLTPKTMMSAIWGFKGSNLDNFVATIFTPLTLFGIFRLFARNTWGLGVTVVTLFIGTLIMMFHLQYDYGAYKLLLLNWWALSFASMFGFSFLMKPFRRIPYRIAMVFIIVVYFFAVATSTYSFDKIVTAKSIAVYKNIMDIIPLIKNESVIVHIDEPITNQWAVYFLRDIPIYLATYRSYMAQAHLACRMEEAKRIDPTKARYLLSDSCSPFDSEAKNHVWQHGLLRLWQIPKEDWVLLTHIENPNGIEEWEGERSFWIGAGTTTISLFSSGDGQAVISGKFSSGPSLPERPERSLIITAENGHTNSVTITTTSKYSFLIPLVRGKNIISLYSPDIPTLKKMPNGDARPLLIGVQGLKTTFEKPLSTTIN
jgi:hypothetical protein